MSGRVNALQSIAHDIFAIAYAENEMNLSVDTISARIGAVYYSFDTGAVSKSMGNVARYQNLLASGSTNVSSHLNSLRTGGEGRTKWAIEIMGAVVYALVDPTTTYASTLRVGPHAVAQWVIDLLIADKQSAGELKAPKTDKAPKADKKRK